ncbi:MAG: C_GCAxxG_C_C family protein [Actinobacteria bacterium]|nr:C_GCAxxG_C_C family protein [Actinomycetota bacterium]
MGETGDYGMTGERAVELFRSGMNCAEAVLASNMETLGIEEEWIPGVASGFGEGIAGTGQVCGALSGAIIVLGWAYGKDSGEDGVQRVYELGQKLVDEFVEEHVTTSCGMLIDINLRDRDLREKARKDGIYEKRCASFVRFCAGRAAEMISERKT